MLDLLCLFFFHSPPPTEIYTYCHTLSLHDALPISSPPRLRVEHVADGRRVSLPAREFGGEVTASGRCEAIEARAPAGVGVPPFGVEPPLVQIGRAHV